MSYNKAINMATHERVQTNPVDLLNKVLSAMINLSLVTRQAGWHIRSPQFNEAVPLIKSMKEKLEDHVETITERFTGLGEVALNDFGRENREKLIDYYPIGLKTMAEHRDALSERYTVIAKRIEDAAYEAEANGDEASCDIFKTLVKSLHDDVGTLHHQMQQNDAI